MLLTAFAVWLLEERAPGKIGGVAPAIVLGLCGIGLIAVAVIESGQGWIGRMGVLATCSAAGGSLGGIAAAVRWKRRAGAILASLGISASSGNESVAVVFLSVGIIGGTMQFVEFVMNGYRPAATLFLIGQALFYLAFIIWMRRIARTPWSFAEHGILGPTEFVPWPRVMDYRWQDSETLAITMTTGWRRLTIPVAPESRERAATILAGKLAQG